MAQFPSVSIGDAAGLRDVGTLHSQLKPLSEAVEILTGQRGKVRAVLTDSVVIDPSDWVVLKQIRSPAGAVFSAAGGVPSYNDYVNSLNDLQQLVADVAALQQVLQTLVRSLRT